MLARNNSCLVSIIISTYNEGKYIDACLSSLINQSYGNKEIIIVDDGSTDNTVNIVKKYSVKLIKEIHKGSGCARNKGAGIAKGEIFLFLDGDMRYDRNYVEKLVKPIIEKKVIGTFNKEELVANPQNLWSRCWSINSDLKPGERAVNIPNKIPVFRAILRKYFVKAGGFDPSYGYFDDLTLAKKLRLMAENAKGAISYHFNPETLADVYLSSRWIGRSHKFKKNVFNFLRFSPVNSVRIGLNKIISGAPIAFILFKIIYDFGMLNGIYSNTNENFK